MTIKERIYAEIDHIGAESLDELYGLIKSFVKAQAGPPQPGILAKLRRIQIEAPADFAANLDLYQSGEKRVEDHVR